MLEVTVDQAYNMAGVYNDDSDLERDLKFAAWVNRQNWRCVRTQQELEQARVDGVEIIIKKENVS